MPACQKCGRSSFGTVCKFCKTEKPMENNAQKMLREKGVVNQLLYVDFVEKRHIRVADIMIEYSDMVLSRTIRDDSDSDKYQRGCVDGYEKGQSETIDKVLEVIKNLKPGNDLAGRSAFRSEIIQLISTEFNIP